MGFSKEVDNLRAACAIQIAHCNICWRPRQKQGGKRRPTPAMTAGIVDMLWKMMVFNNGEVDSDTFLQRAGAMTWTQAGRRSVLASSDKNGLRHLHHLTSRC